MMAHPLLCAVCMVVISSLASSQLCSNPTTAAPGDELLFDSYNNMSLPWTNSSNSILRSDADCRPFVEVCTTAGTFLVYTQFIRKPLNASLINVVVEFNGSICDDGSEGGNMDCHMFSLLLYESSAEADVAVLSDINSYNVSIQTVSSGESIRVNATQEGFYLGFSGMMACVNITRVRVTYTSCPVDTSSLAEYPLSNSGSSVTGMCVANSASIGGQSLTAFCNLSTGYEFSSQGCTCNAGYTVSTDSSRCEACPAGTYKMSSGSGSCLGCPQNSNSSAGSTSCGCNERYKRPTSSTTEDACSDCVTNSFYSRGTCVSCPANSISPGGKNTSCTCLDGRTTEDGRTTTTDASLPCDRCQTNYNLVASSCQACPLNSVRAHTADGDQDMCTCAGNSSTSTGSSRTTSSACDGCADGFFNSQSSSSTVMCVRCPVNSNSMRASDIECTCTDGAFNEQTGGMTTTNADCSGCAAGYFRIGSGTCLLCPPNSFRLRSTDDDMICSCEENYGRQSSAESSNRCAPYVGFESETAELLEGSHTILVRLSSPEGKTISVPFSTTDDSSYVATTTPLDFAANSSSTNIQVTVEDDTIAVQESQKFTITLRSTVDAVAERFPGTPFLYPSITVTIMDNDKVRVGFTTETMKYNESERDLALNITRLERIAGNFELTIQTDDDGKFLKIPNTLVVFSPTTASVSVPFDIIDNAVGGMPDRTVTLTLEYNSPENFRNYVDIGGGETYANIKIVIVEDDPSVPPSPFPVAGIVGASVAAAGLAVLLLLIVILCFCIVRLRVNRQGFYPTYEDKTSEPPTMLRYSASLRSISSQTVVGVNEGKSVTRENEFYV